jgi:hypothetical protein
MINNKKGLSTVVTTLIIVLLVLVAVGIIWGVVSNLLDKSAGNVDTATKCLDIKVMATNVVDVGNATLNESIYDVTLERTTTGDDEIGAKVIFFSSTSNTEPLDFANGSVVNMLTRAEIATETFNLTGKLDGTPIKVKVIPYFIDESGKENLCSTSSEYEFTLSA